MERLEFGSSLKQRMGSAAENRRPSSRPTSIERAVNLSQPLYPDRTLCPQLAGLTGKESIRSSVTDIRPTIPVNSDIPRAASFGPKTAFSARMIQNNQFRNYLQILQKPVPFVPVVLYTGTYFVFCTNPELTKIRQGFLIPGHRENRF